MINLYGSNYISFNICLHNNFSFLVRIKRLRKVLGGGWRNPGLLAAACQVALEDVYSRLADDHRRARKLADAFERVGKGVFKVNPVYTNIIFVQVVKQGITAEDLSNYLSKVSNELRISTNS